MRAVLVIFDSLNRRYLPPYDADWVIAPNFERLAERAVVFENSYGGSMPCIPARREMHTGRVNFLHRGWGPLEPFDDSMPRLLRDHGVYSHLVTDHQHYFEPGGATYHTSFNSWEFFRGQEGDLWKGQVSDPPANGALTPGKRRRWRHDQVNRQYQVDEADLPQTLTFDAAVEFIDTNAADDDWFLQIESFDPHEPFNVPGRFLSMYDDVYSGPGFDWPRYARVTEDAVAVEHMRLAYAALVTMCDHSLGRVLDAFDRHGLWADTMLIVGTDHGFMLGERGFWAKNIQPWFSENIHTPLMIADPRHRDQGGQRRQSLVQTIDWAPTLLDLFGVDVPSDVEGVPLTSVIGSDDAVREAGLFGLFGAHVNVTDGRYVYMRAAATDDNGPLYEYTLMPSRMDEMFGAELERATLSGPFAFTKNMPTLRVPSAGVVDAGRFGTMLFDLRADPLQSTPIVDDEVETRMAGLMVELMRRNDAPIEQFERLGLPSAGPVGPRHLAARRHRERVTEVMAPLPPAAEVRRISALVDWPLSDLIRDPVRREVIEARLPGLMASEVVRDAGDLSLYEVAAMLPGRFSGQRLIELVEALEGGADVR